MDIQITIIERTVIVILLFLICLFLTYRLWSQEALTKGRNPGHGRKALLLLIGFMLGDLLLLALVSFVILARNRFYLQLFLLGTLRFLLTLIFDFGRKLVAVFLRKPTASTFPAAIGAWIVVNLAITAGVFYGMYIEALNPRLTTTQIPAAVQIDGRPLRIVHLTDIHIPAITPREEKMLALVDSVQPDLILMTGDYLFLDLKYDPEAQAAARQVFAQLHAPLGVYAVASISIDSQPVVEQVFGPLDNIRFLWNELVPVDTGNQMVYLLGVTDTWNVNADAAHMQALLSEVPAGGYTILMYHKPEMVPYAAQAGIDLQLSGHTHGGQVRIPGYGALVKSADGYEKNYDMGLYTVGATHLYVSRGLGVEGMGYPPIRFNCPPEVALIELGR